jgi:hypothetical protein
MKCATLCINWRIPNQKYCGALWYLFAKTMTTERKGAEERYELYWGLIRLPEHTFIMAVQGVELLVVWAAQKHCPTDCPQDCLLLALQEREESGLNLVWADCTVSQPHRSCVSLQRIWRCWALGQCWLKAALKTSERLGLRLSLSQPALCVCQLIANHFLFVNVQSEEPGGQLQKQHNMQTQITKDNWQDTNETDN